MDHITMKKIEQALQESINVKQTILTSDLLESVAQAAALMEDALRSGHKILFCGNGGSAADAQHLAAELSGRFYFDRPPLPAEALHCNSSYLTAVANDYGYDEVYARIVRGSANQGDVLIGLSTSGNSENIVKAFDAAREQGMKIIAFTGESGGKMKARAHILLNVPSHDTPRIQEAHITLGHIICELVEAALFSAP